MGIFRKKVNIDALILSYVNSMLPDSAMAYSPLSQNSKTNSIAVSTKPASMSFEYSFDNNDIDELSDIDKLQLDAAIIIPALKQLDKELFAVHNKIEETLKRLQC